MRRVWVNVHVCVLIAAAFAVGAGEVWAQQMVTTTSAVARPDFAELQTMALEWLRTTVTSSQFICGAILGAAITEAGRFVWRWSMRTFGVAQTAARFVINHRLVAVAVIAASYYLVAHRIMA